MDYNFYFSGTTAAKVIPLNIVKGDYSTEEKEKLATLATRVMNAKKTQKLSPSPTSRASTQGQSGKLVATVIPKNAVKGELSSEEREKLTGIAKKVWDSGKSDQDLSTSRVSSPAQSGNLVAKVSPRNVVKGDLSTLEKERLAEISKKVWDGRKSKVDPSTQSTTALAPKLTNKEQDVIAEVKAHEKELWLARKSTLQGVPLQNNGLPQGYQNLEQIPLTPAEPLTPEQIVSLKTNLPLQANGLPQGYQAFEVESPSEETMPMGTEQNSSKKGLHVHEEGDDQEKGRQRKKIAVIAVVIVALAIVALLAFKKKAISV